MINSKYQDSSEVIVRKTTTYIKKMNDLSIKLSDPRIKLCAPNTCLQRLTPNPL